MRKIFNIVLLILVIIAILFSVSALVKDRPTLIVRNLQGKDLESKVVVLKLKLLGIIPLATARIEELEIERYNRRDVYHLKATARVLPYISRFFKARAEADSYVDVKNLHSLKFVQHVETPGDYDYNREIFYDQRRKIMSIGDVQREILDDTQDPLSAIFYLRQQEFEVGKEFNININTNQKNYLLSVKVQDYYEINMDDDKIGIWVLSAEVRRHGKSPRHKSSVKIWFLDNETKTPILIKIVASGGLITARLVGLE